MIDPRLGHRPRVQSIMLGRAVVSTNVGDVPFLVEDGRTGFVARCGEDATLAERITMLITNHDLCYRMGKSGRTRAEREFGLDRLVSETLAAYRAAGWKEH